MTRSVAILAVLAFLSLASPPAAAHGGPPPSYDPLVINIDGWLTADAKIAPQGPDSGIVYFPQFAPGSDAAPLTFTMDAPVAFSPQGFHVILQLRADKPVATNSANGPGLKIELLRDGKPVDGASAEMAFSRPAMQPGDNDHIDLTLSTTTNVTFAKGSKVALRLTPEGPAMVDGSLGVVVGKTGASTADFPFALIPSVADLELEDEPYQQYDMVTQNASYADASLLTNDIEVYHDRIVENLINFIGPKAYLNFKGAELSNDALQYHAFPDRASRLNATHDFTLGSHTIRVHPGVGTVLLVDLSAGPQTLKCVKNCPEPFELTLRPDTSQQARGKPGIPNHPTVASPTLPTTGTKVDTASEKQAPGPTFPLAVLAIAALAAATRRRA